MKIFDEIIELILMAVMFIVTIFISVLPMAVAIGLGLWIFKNVFN